MKMSTIDFIYRKNQMKMREAVRDDHFAILTIQNPLLAFEISKW